MYVYYVPENKCIKCTDYDGRNPKQVSTTGSVRHVASIHVSDVKDDSLYYLQNNPNRYIMNICI